MSRDLATLPRARTWREIPQEVKPRAMSRGGRRRLAGRTARAAGVCAALAASGWGAWQVAATLRKGPPQDAAPRLGAPLFTTDGVLDRAWLARALDLPADATLMSLDLGRLRARLLADRQVAAASLERRFPATLVVHVSEREPVARVAVQEGPSDPRAYLVARDGVVYPGTDYPRGLVASLPWLDGVRLRRTGSGFTPVDGMAAVAELLSEAKMDAEGMYRTWRVVSLARLASDGEIEVRTADGMRATFGTREDFLRQLARLDAILGTARSRPGTPPLSSVDLALGAQVPVAFAQGREPDAGGRTNFNPSSAREF